MANVRVWSIGYLWHWMNWLGCLDVTLLALMFAYIVIAVIRFSHLYRIARRAEQSNTHNPKIQRIQRNLATDLSLRISSLTSIASTAPFLGLAGTCFGILSAFRGVGMEKHAALIMITSEIAASLVTTAVGILVAIPAVWSYNYLCTCIELLYSGTSSRTLQPVTLRKQSSVLPAFGTMAALTLAAVVSVYLTFSPSHISRGYSVRVATDICGCCPSSRIFHLHVSNDGGVRLKSEDVPANKLARSLSDIYAVRAERILYLSVDSDTTFQTVAEVIGVTQNLEFPDDALEPPQLRHTRPMPVEVRLITKDFADVRCPAR